MKPCKRIEIVIEQPLQGRMAQLLKDLGAPGYTLIRRASGMGDRGLRRADDPTGSETNSVFIIACDEPETVTRIIEGIRPVLSESGGMCVVADAEWVRH
jgi:PII-like signaling protein